MKKLGKKLILISILVLILSSMAAPVAAFHCGFITNPYHVCTPNVK